MPAARREQDSGTGCFATIMGFSLVIALSAGVIFALNESDATCLWRVSIVVFLGCLGAIALAVLPIAIHEGAHLMAGLLTGHVLYKLRVGFLTLSRFGEDYVISLRDDYLLSGECGMAMKELRGQLAKTLIYVAAAPTVSVAYAVLLLLTFYWATPAPWIEVMRPVSLLLVVPAVYVAAVPFIWPQASDFEIIRRVWKQREDAPVYAAARYIEFQRWCRLRPRSYSLPHIEVLSRVRTESAQSFGALWTVWEYWHDRQDLREMEGVLNSLFAAVCEADRTEKEESRTSVIEAVAALEIIEAYFLLLKERDIARARATLENVGDQAYVGGWFVPWRMALELAVECLEEDPVRFEQAKALYRQLTTDGTEPGDICDYVAEHIRIWLPEFDPNAASDKP